MQSPEPDISALQIVEVYGRTVRLSVRFSHADGPTIRELVLLRQWIPEFTHLPPAQVRSLVGKTPIYFAGEYGGKDGENRNRSGKRLGLDVIAETTPDTYTYIAYLGSFEEVQIDDEQLRETIMNKIRAAGGPIQFEETD